MKKRTKKKKKKNFQTFDEHESNQSSKVEQTSDSPVLLAVTRHLLECQILTITWWKHIWKVQRYATLGTAVILGDFTLEFHTVFSRWRGWSSLSSVTSTHSLKNDVWTYNVTQDTLQGKNF